MDTQPSERGESDVAQQDEELQVLESIYPNEFSIVDPDHRCYKISVNSDSAVKHNVVLRFTFSDGYPSEKAPTFEISAPDLQRGKRLELSNVLSDLCKASIGSPVIYSMVETIRSFLEELASETPPLDTESHETSDNDDCQFIPVVKPVYSVPSVREHLAARGSYLPIAEGAARPTIYHGETISDRKSVFQAHCCVVNSLADVSAFISTILEDRKVAAASHNITAWYLQAKLKPDAPKTSLVADYDDDGEAQAGGRLLHLISMSAREGVAVMVSRWYGGIHIGPDRFKHINNAANQLLMQQGLTKNAANSGTAQSKSKKHVKKKQ